MRTPLLLAWLCVAPIAFAAQAPTPTNGLARARALFSSADLDGNSRLTPQELRDRQIAVTDREFRDEDMDRDGSWSRDEFTVHYRAMLARSGERAAADFEAELVRILALRRARTVDESRGRHGPAVGRLAVRVDPASGATPEILELDARLERAITDLEDRAAGRGAVRGDFDRVRGLWNDRLTRVRILGEPVSETADQGVRFLRALDGLEARARAGSVARNHFAELRSIWDARPRRVVTREVSAEEAPRPVERADPASIEARFDRALADLEARVFARVATRDHWHGLHELLPERARRVVQGSSPAEPSSADSRVVRVTAELRQALDRMESLAGLGTLARSDFQDLRSRLTAEKAKGPGPSSPH